ncbi:pyridoxamine 5'-phosphate oxidase family protein [Nitrosomonas aestuarii]|uniref:pyridoxamine 5'-phosphate oxidase family protein n=1 Tax=Nitrosomonas aestuarii TaxID=52441 RepID=UPI000D31F6A6|nr:pyridoxamine 5'-phosphate oxidase family protein [Nitrosomonas aestuarii]PTN11514.1 pyridoxamine 5'-phosphate oxidase [Nitrosomonas aestuarii]
MIEEPALGFGFNVGSSSSNETETSLSLRIKQLMDSQPFAVLCTQGEQQPYGSLVAYSMTDDLTAVVFATPVTTRKFKLLNQNDRVALLIDNRCQHHDNMMNVRAVTATGFAKQVESDKEFKFWSRLLTVRHSNLSNFVHSPTVALFSVDIARYFHVERFQEVQQWIPQRIIPG